MYRRTPWAQAVYARTSRERRRRDRCRRARDEAALPYRPQTGFTGKEFYVQRHENTYKQESDPGVLLALFCINRSFFARCPYANTLIYTRELISL